MIKPSCRYLYIHGSFEIKGFKAHKEACWNACKHGTSISLLCGERLFKGNGAYRDVTAQTSHGTEPLSWSSRPNAPLHRCACWLGRENLWWDGTQEWEYWWPRTPNVWGFFQSQIQVPLIFKHSSQKVLPEKFWVIREAEIFSFCFVLFSNRKSCLEGRQNRIRSHEWGPYEIYRVITIGQDIS